MNKIKKRNDESRTITKRKKAEHKSRRKEESRIRKSQ